MGVLHGDQMMTVDRRLTYDLGPDEVDHGTRVSSDQFLSVLPLPLGTYLTNAQTARRPMFTTQPASPSLGTRHLGSLRQGCVGTYARSPGSPIRR